MSARAKILYVDDDDDIRAIAEMSLALDDGLDVRTAGSGRQGVELALAWRPDLIMLDYMMPDLDGPGTLALIKARPETASIPVLFITARTQAHQVADMIGMGAVGVVSKPFDPMTLAQDIRAYLGGARAS